MKIISRAQPVHQNPAAEGAKKAEGLGLVYSETSGTPNPKTPQTQQKQYIVSPKENRLKRLRRSIVTAARLHQQSMTETKARFKVAMLTLTYSPYEVWEPNQIAELIRHVRQYLKRRNIPSKCVWVMELTKAGVPHYHLLFWLPKGQNLPKPDKQGWWPYGHTKIEWARKAVSYIAKYASKAQSGGSFPEGARIHGFGGLAKADRNERSWWMLPQYMRQYTPEYRDTGPSRRAKGGGWLTPFGEWIPPKFQVISFNPLTIQEVY